MQNKLLLLLLLLHKEVQEILQTLHSTFGYPYRTPNPELQKTESSSIQNPILHTEGKEIFEYIQIFQTFQTFRSFMTFSLSRQYFPFQYIQGSTPLQHSPITMHILHILHFNWFPQKLHRVPLETLQTTNFHSFFKEREMLRYRSKYVICIGQRCQDDITSK